MCPAPLQQTFTAALDALIEDVKKDRAILAAVLCGSLSHDTVWAKSDIDFKRHFDIEGVTIACEYLADRGLIAKAATSVRLTKRSTGDVQELAFFYAMTARLASGGRARMAVFCNSVRPGERVMHKTLKGLFCTALIVSAAGCGGSSTSPGNSNSKRTMTAVIDGVAYSGFVHSASLSVTGTLNIGSQTTDYTTSIAFTVTNATVGTFNVADRVLATTQTSNGINTLTGVWIAAGTLGSGTVTISSLTASGASGTFAFNAPANGQGATGTKVVTNGVFTATF